MVRANYVAVLAGLLGACHPAASGPTVTAVVESAEWNCGYTETETTTMGGSVVSAKMHDVSKDCSHDPKFIAIRDGTSNGVLTGHVTAVLRYADPADKTSHQAWLKIDASDHAFYTLAEGQQLQVQIDPANPNKASL